MRNSVSFALHPTWPRRMLVPCDLRNRLPHVRERPSPPVKEKTYQDVSPACLMSGCRTCDAIGRALMPLGLQTFTRPSLATPGHSQNTLEPKLTSPRRPGRESRPDSDIAKG